MNHVIGVWLPDHRMQGEVLLIYLVVAVAVIVMATVRTVPAVRNIVVVSPAFQGDWEGVKIMAYPQVLMMSLC